LGRNQGGRELRLLRRPSGPSSQDYGWSRGHAGLEEIRSGAGAEEEIYWGCFYFFPWLRMWRREKSAAPPQGQKLEPLPRLVSCLSRGLGPHPSRRSSPRRPAVPPRGTQQASVYGAGAQPLPSSAVENAPLRGHRSVSPIALLSDSPVTLPLDPSISCCTQVYRRNLPSKLLRNVFKVELQEANGDCHIQAYVLHRNHGRPVCVHPKNRSLARWVVPKQDEAEESWS
ncbi:uncharacterized protein LOC122752567, partial [Dromiciops gliroides]|uniref:uncharacterized protein LOC122752567 n=1 Tax=Dromiciops gliroides TaxID=33562 RepID=UPI001CC74CF0